MSEQQLAQQGVLGGRSAAASLRAEIEEAISGLDQATQAFAARLADLGEAGTPATAAPAPQASAPPPPPTSATAPHQAPESPTPGPFAGRPGPDPFEARMREAEQQAEEYLDRAKARADGLVTSMLGAVERQSEQIRAETEAAIRERWEQIERQAGTYLDEARRVADGMVEERQRKLSSLSDGIAQRAEALTQGMDDAERVRRQFEMFIAALSETARRIAAEADASPGPRPVERQFAAPDRPAARIDLVA